MLPRARSHPFPATRRLALGLTALLALHAILAGLALQAVFVFVELTWRVIAGRDELRLLLATHVEQFRVLRLVQVGLGIVTAAVFIRWVDQARRNLPALGIRVGPEAPGRTVAAFLVPGPNLVRPLAIMRELWKASDPRPAASAAPRPGRTPARIRWWWGLLVAAVVTDATARGLALWSGGSLDFGPAMRLLLVAQALVIAAAAVGIALVLGVDTRQEAAAGRRARDSEPG